MIIARGQITVYIAEKGDPGTPGTPGQDGQYTAYQYAKNTLPTTAPTTGWVATPPAIGTGEYLWMRTGTVTPPATSPALWSVAVRISGDKGEQGNPGQPGTQGPPGSAGTSGPAVVYRGTFSASTIYHNNSLRRDIVRYGTTFYIYKGTNALAASWNVANWENFGAEFTSVATGLLLAELAYIENLGVRNLVTSATGQRIEITAARNSMAFYTAAQSTPVLEIKTTSDSVYMGQGAGFQIKQTGVNISMFKGYLHQGSEGSGISVPVLPMSQPESIAQHCILQSYTNSATGKYKTGIYIAMSGTQGTASTADKMNGIHIETGGMFIGGDYTTLRSNNVLAGVVAAGKVSQTGSLLKSWVLSYMGGYLTSTRTATGRYRISFSNTSYLYNANDYSVIFMPDGPQASGSHGAYACTMARTNSYFDVWTSDDASTNDCGFSFIVVIMNKFWSY